MQINVEHLKRCDLISLQGRFDSNSAPERVGELLYERCSRLVRSDAFAFQLAEGSGVVIPFASVGGEQVGPPTNHRWPLWLAENQKCRLVTPNQGSSAPRAGSESWARLPPCRCARRRIQESFLPECCSLIPGWQFGLEWRAARGVGGDFYDFIDVGPDRLGVVIADVSDKGAAAALYMALCRTVMRTVSRAARGPADALRQANRVLLEDSGGGWTPAIWWRGWTRLYGASQVRRRRPTM